MLQDSDQHLQFYKKNKKKINNEIKNYELNKFIN